ncbi:MAG: hypothetical protein ACRD0Y_14430 [Terriglobales bacterium]
MTSLVVFAALLAAGASAQVDATSPAPLSFQIGGAEFTPGGFMDFTSVLRTTNVGSGIGTSFGSIPFSNTTAGHLSEERMSLQNSRLSLAIASKRGDTDYTGYVEADFLGNAANSLVVSSNANTLRMRLFWFDARHGKWEVLAGQSWSLLTPNRDGVGAMPSDIFYTQDMDTNYQAGLVWTRAPQLRLVYHATPNLAWGMAVENPEQYVTSAVTFPAVDGAAYASQFDIGGSGSSTPNLRPLLIAKLAWDRPAPGHHLHLEIAGESNAVRVYSPVSGKTATANGAGVSLNGSAEIAPGVSLIATLFYSDGGGRLIQGLGPDAVIRPNGTPALVRSDSSILGFEAKRGSNLLFGYYSLAYFGRAAYRDTNGSEEGFGFAGSSSSANRSIQEATLGLTHTFWKDPHYGALELISQYSYLLREPWSVNPDNPRNAKTNMMFLDLRYVLP